MCTWPESSSESVYGTKVTIRTGEKERNMGNDMGRIGGVRGRCSALSMYLSVNGSSCNTLPHTINIYNKN